MNEQHSPDAAGLRRHTEARLQAQARVAPAITGREPTDDRQALHELQVHQIELEMQNEELRRTQVELDAARARYFELYDLAPVSYLTLSEPGLILEANLTAATLLGTPRSALVERPLSQFIASEDANLFHLHRKKLFKTGRPEACELRLVKKDGTRLWACLTGTAAQDGQGLPVCHLALTDITQQKEAAADLLDTQENLLTLINALPDTVIFKDGAGRWLVANPSAVKFFQLKEFPWIGKTDAELALERPVLKEFFAACIRSDEASWAAGRITRVTERGPGADGEMRELEVHKVPLFHAEGSRHALVVIGRDVTDQRRQAQALKMSELMASQSQDVLLLIRYRDFRVITANAAAVEFYGYAYAELLTKTIYDLRQNHDPRQIASQMTEAFAHGLQFETVHVRKDNQPVSVEVSSHGASFEGEEFLVSSIRDITNRKRQEEQLRQAQKMESIGILAGGVAHDFNNILASQLLQLDLLPTTGLTAELQDGLAQIRADAQRAANLVRQLLLYSRRQVMQAADLELHEIVTQFSRMLQRIIGEDIQLELHLHHSPLNLHADSGMIEQVIMNLATNARDAMPKGGQLVIKTSATTLTEAAAQRLNAEAGAGIYACLSVSDTGTGIPPEVLPRIFEPFFTTKEVGKGTGLGLASVFGIMKQHHGGIEVNNRPGKGATFSVYFPALAAPVAKAVSAAEKAPVRGGTETLLLVEDEPTMRKLTRRLIERQGYRVLEAANGPEALEVWQKHREAVALLLTDLVMPAGLSGLELASRLLTEKPGLKVIFMSGYSQEAVQGGPELLASQSFIQKPFAPGQLLKTLRTSLDKAA